MHLLIYTRLCITWHSTMKSNLMQCQRNFLTIECFQVCASNVNRATRRKVSLKRTIMSDRVRRAIILKNCYLLLLLAQYCRHFRFVYIRLYRQFAVSYPLSLSVHIWLLLIVLKKENLPVCFYC